jgi:hypothetical protein
LFCLSLILPAVTCMNNIDIYTKFSNSTNIKSLDNWIQSQKLITSDGIAGEHFGCSVSLSGDTALIGAAWRDCDDGTEVGTGAAYVFIRNGTIWTQQAKLLASDGSTEDGFGGSVSLDGDTALIGAEWDDDNGTCSGSAYVFTRNGTTWTQQAKLTASDGTAADHFGCSVSLSGDTALIGAFFDEEYGWDGYVGSAYVFTRNGTKWIQQQKLTTLDGWESPTFGWSVSLSGDTALIGAIYGSNNDGWMSGSAYVFTFDDRKWIHQQKLTASDSGYMDGFGSSVSLYGDTALIGAEWDDNGSAYVFTRNGTKWIQQQKLTASDGKEFNLFGGSVSLDGDTALIGAYGDDRNKEYPGSAYVFTYNGSTWIQQQKLTASDGNKFDNFGCSVCLNGDIALIGARYDDDKGTDSGSAYIFTKNKSPYKPTITGQVKIRPNREYEYKFVSMDPEGDDIEYCIDWGDNSSEVIIGPYPSGAEATAKHAWSEEGSYIIKAKARDVYGAESDWATLTVSMPKNKMNYVLNSLLGRLLNYLSFFPIWGE